MENISILWADDEIDLLKPHILFLQQKGYEVITTNNGAEAMDFIRERDFDIVFLDEHMPGMSGIETLAGIKNLYQQLLSKYNDSHMVEHHIMECLGQMMWEAQRNQAMPDDQQYMECLRKLL